MNLKRIFLIILSLLAVGAIAFTVYYFVDQDKNSLTVSEKNWIENNKNNLIDFSILNTAPVLSDTGSGVIFDFLNDLEKDTGLEFNKLSHSYNSKAPKGYSFTIKPKANKKDILIYRDNYVLVTKNRVKYNNLSEINNIIIGVLEKDTDNIDKYMSGVGNITYQNYKTTDEMFEATTNNQIDALIVPKIQYLDKIIENEDLNIAYDIVGYTQDYVFNLGRTAKLNKILNKYYNKWQHDNFNELFAQNLIQTYFDASDTEEQEQVKFHSKQYNYGFVLNAPFDVTTSGGIKGFNYSILNSFAQASGIEINYKKYSNIKSLVNDFEANKLDVIFNYHYQEKYNMDVYNTVSVYDEKIAIISDQNTKVVDNVSSLENQVVMTIKNSQIDSYMQKNKIKTKSYNNIKDLVNHLTKNSIAAIDYYTYDYYVRNRLNNFKLLGVVSLDGDYDFISRDISANKTFNELLNFYISFNNTEQIINDSYKDLLEYNYSNKLIRLLILVFSAILLVLFGILTGRFIKHRKSHNNKLSKTDKLRYVDTMTSLKNRNYLNENIDVWDNSDIYPQTIIIVDLNNIAYINDNFGHAEGDKVIVEGAGVLIANQLSNSEIIRTNGNEFLIFMVGHEEKAVISYIRKLHKEFKNISHGFGAAIGYSMITDEIKTIDDAVNEATADMRSNKEEK